PPPLYPRSLHDALPSSGAKREVCRARSLPRPRRLRHPVVAPSPPPPLRAPRRRLSARLSGARFPSPDQAPARDLPLLLLTSGAEDRKSTRLNSSHVKIS